MQRERVSNNLLSLHVNSKCVAACHRRFASNENNCFSRGTRPSHKSSVLVRDSADIVEVYQKDKGEIFIGIFDFVVVVVRLCSLSRDSRWEESQSRRTDPSLSELAEEKKERTRRAENTIGGLTTNV